MATTKTQPATDMPPAVDGVEYMTLEEGRLLLDQQARTYLNMSGIEFVRRWRAGDIDDPDRPEVMRVAMLLPFAD